VPIVWHEERSILWKCPLPEWGTSTPAVWGGAAFVTTHTADDKLLLLRIDRQTGKIVWTQQVGDSETTHEGPQRHAQKFHKYYSPAGPSPVTDGQVVVVHFGNGDLAAYDFAGNQLWKHNLQDDYGGTRVGGGCANSPVIAGDVMNFVCR
jgi:outer membrane protein assembly factor BamB